MSEFRFPFYWRDFLTDGDPDEQKELSLQRDMALEDWLNGHTETMSLSFGGDLADLTVSEKSAVCRTSRDNLFITKVVVDLATAGSTTTTVNLYMNGTLFDTVSLASSETEATAVVDYEPVSSTDRWQVDVSAIGTGAKKLTVTLHAL